jgi:hypothetical protein
MILRTKFPRRSFKGSGPENSKRPCHCQVIGLNAKILLKLGLERKTQAALTLTVHKKTVTAVLEQWQHTQGSKTVTSKTCIYQQEKAVPARERLYQQEKHLTAKAAPAIATRDFKQQLERGLQLAEKEEAVPAGEGCTSKRNT